MGVTIGHIGTQDLYPRPERRCAVFFVAAADEDLCASESCISCQFRGGACLANTWLAQQEHRSPATSQRLLQAFPQLVHLPFSSDKNLTSQAIQRIDWRTRTRFAEGCGRRRKGAQDVPDGKGTLRPVLRQLGQELQN